MSGELWKIIFRWKENKHFLVVKFIKREAFENNKLLRNRNESNIKEIAMQTSGERTEFMTTDKLRDN